MTQVAMLSPPPVPFNKGNYSYPDINNIDFNSLVNGLYGKPPVGMPDPHGHHFPYKKGRGKQQPIVDSIQDILVLDYDIDPIKGEEVLCWAPNRVKGQHAKEQLESYYNELKAIKERGGTREDVVALTKKYQEKDAARGSEKTEKTESACPEK